MSIIVPGNWKDVSVRTYGDINTDYNDYSLSEVGYDRVWEFFYTGSVDTFTVPSGCQRIKVECIGAGGRDDSTSSSGKHGGGGGSYAASYFDVSASEEYDVYVGKGAEHPDSDGEDSTFDSGGGKEVRGAGAHDRNARGGSCVGNLLINSGGNGGFRHDFDGAGGGGGGGGGASGAGASGQNGWSLGAGGNGGSGNGGENLFTGKGGAGGRKGVVGVPGEAGEDGQEEIPDQEVTKNYYATWSESYYNTGVNHNSPRIYQGNPQVDSQGPRFAKIGFNDSQIRSDLDGNEVDRVRLRMTLEHSYWFAGLDPGLRLGTHNRANEPNFRDTTGHHNQWQLHNGWQAGETKWMTLSLSNVGEAFQSGAIKGLTVGRVGAGNRDDYGYFRPYNASNSQRPLLEIRYIIPGQEGVAGDPGSKEIPGMSGRPGKNGRFPGGGAGGGGWDDVMSFLSGNAAHGYVRITEVA